MLQVKHFFFVTQNGDLAGATAICDTTNSARDVYWDRGLVQGNGNYTRVVSPVVTENTCTQLCFPKVPSRKKVEGKMVLSCPPQLSWEGKRERG